MNILIVDDNQLIVDDLTIEVKDICSDSDIYATTSIANVLKHIEHTEYDIAIIDIDMPVMDGLTLARNIIASSPAVNIIFITGFKEYALEAHEMYCSAFLVKPVSNKKLRKAFENLRNPVLNLPANFSEDYYSGATLIGKRIELYRKQRNLSRQELADYMKVTRQTVFRWETGERVPDIITFLKLTRILGVDIATLLGD